MYKFDIQTASRILKFWKLRQTYHRATIAFVDNIPADGGVLLVSNHGRLDFDSFILIRLIFDSCGCFVRLMGDRIWFKLPIFRSIAPLVGAVEGNRSNAVALLRSGQVVLTYPGGVPEIMTSHFSREHIRWSNRTGFARVAIEAQVPVVPVASLGVNNGFIFLTQGKFLGRLLFRGLFRMGPSYDSYRDPLVIGVVPIPLPFSTAVHFPLPCKVRYIVGDPIQPTVGPEHADDDLPVQTFADRVASALQHLIWHYGSTA
jgi:1-acyl-sn-glycerol-3-phosphate acyltransferase